MSPVYKGLVYKNTGSSIHNAKAPLYYVTGAAVGFYSVYFVKYFEIPFCTNCTCSIWNQFLQGCHTHIDVKGVTPRPFSEFMTSDYGYSILEVTVRIFRFQIPNSESVPLA